MAQELYQLAVPVAFRQLLGANDEQEFCRWLGSPGRRSEKWRWFATGQSRDSRSISTYSKFHIDYSARDCFISPNQFFGWRTGKLLSQLHANWLEIDTVAHAVLDSSAERRIVQEALHQLEKQECPPPTCYVTSGSGGVHLYWIYDGIAAVPAHKQAWKSVTRALGSNLRKGGQHWKVDFNASNNAAGMMRLPGTRHTKSGHFSKVYIGGPIYTFENLARSLKINFSLQTKIPPTAAAPTPSKTIPAQSAFEFEVGEQRASGRHTMRQWWTRIYWHVVKHLRENGVQEGQRDLALFILYVAQRHIHQHEEDAYKQICELNESLIGLDTDQVETYLGTARVTDYRYRKDSVADYLSSAFEMNVDFLYESQQTTLSADERKIRQQLGATITANGKRQKSLHVLTDHYRNFESEHGSPPTQSQLVELTGKSLSTVKRHWVHIKQEVENQHIVSFEALNPNVQILVRQMNVFSGNHKRQPTIQELASLTGFTESTIRKYWQSTITAVQQAQKQQGVISSSSIYPPKGTS